MERQFEVPAPIVESIQMAGAEPPTPEEIIRGLADLGALPSGEKSRRVLDVVAFLAADGVPITYLTGLAGGTAADVVTWAEPLSERSLATLVGGTDQVMVVHPRVSQAVRGMHRRDGSAATVVGDAVGLLTAAAPSHDDEHREAWQRLGPQIIALRTNAIGAADPETARSLMKLSATYMDHVVETIDIAHMVRTVSSTYLRDVADLAFTVHALWELSAAYLHHLTVTGDADRAVSLGVDVVADAGHLFDADYPTAVQAAEDLAAARAALDGPAEPV